MSERENLILSSDSPEFDLALNTLLLEDDSVERPDDGAGPIRELDSRHSDGINVYMLRDPVNNNVWIEVDDNNSGEAFIVDVPRGESPYEYFHHPFAKARRYGSEVIRAANTEEN